MKKIVIIAGGTGGHIFPALAVAKLLADNGVDVHWLGTRKGLESNLVPSQYPISYINIRALRGKGWLRKCLLPCKLMIATVKAYFIIRKIDADVVLGMGGYVTGPGGLAAWLARVPLIIHEQNAVAGLTNRGLAKIATKVLQAFPNAFAEKYQAQTVGNPVRAELSSSPLPAERFTNVAKRPLRLLILGGSQGARAINRCVTAMFADQRLMEAVEVWHQTGRLDHQEVQASYQSMDYQQARVDAFITDMAKAYQWADLVICRAGALTVSELMAVGVASICVPYPYAVDNHQLHNCRHLEKAGAAIIIDQQHFNVTTLSQLMVSFLQDRQRLLTMAKKARGLAMLGATQRVAVACDDEQAIQQQC